MEISSVFRARRLASNCGRSFFQHLRWDDNPKIDFAVALRFSKKDLRRWLSSTRPVRDGKWVLLLKTRRRYPMSRCCLGDDRSSSQIAMARIMASSYRPHRKLHLLRKDDAALVRERSDARNLVNIEAQADWP